MFEILTTSKRCSKLFAVKDTNVNYSPLKFYKHVLLVVKLQRKLFPTENFELIVAQNFQNRLY